VEIPTRCLLPAPFPPNPPKVQHVQWGLKPLQPLQPKYKHPEHRQVPVSARAPPGLLSVVSTTVLAADELALQRDALAVGSTPGPEHAGNAEDELQLDALAVGSNPDTDETRLAGNAEDELQLDALAVGSNPDTEETRPRVGDDFADLHGQQAILLDATGPLATNELVIIVNGAIALSNSRPELDAHIRQDVKNRGSESKFCRYKRGMLANGVSTETVKNLSNATGYNALYKENFDLD
jgi:hypothetical protein